MVCTGSGGNTSGGAAGAPGTAGAAGYQPCGGKSCGARCTMCDPNDLNCVEGAVINSCNMAGQCVPGAVNCS